MNKTVILSIISLVFLSTFALAANYNYNYNVQTDVNANAGADAGARVNTGAQVTNEGTNISVTTPFGTQVLINGENVEVNSVGGKTVLKSGNIEVNSHGNEISIDRNGSVSVKMSNGRNAEIKIMPATASATALANMKAKCEVNNCTVELKEVGSGNQTKVQYEVKTTKKAKVLGLFSTDMAISADVDASTGKVVSVNRPWWSFLASEQDESVKVNVNASA